MLSRRFLRVKVLQAVYAFVQQGPESINSGEKQLLSSLDKLYELYIYQFSFLLEMVEFARRRIEEGKQKYLPSPEDLNPNLRFINNTFIRQLESNKDLQSKIHAYKINWSDEEEQVRKCYLQVREMPEYMAYMAARETNYPEDKKIIESVFLNLIADFELLSSYFEEKSIYWTDDFDTSIMLVVKTIRSFKESWGEDSPMPDLLRDQNHPGGSEDLEFMKQLYRRTLIHNEEFNPVINQYAENWELDRIALIDMVLIKMAITELMDFPSIPVKVTLNEYIEISKSFSTPKSKVFINGILDKVIIDFRQNGRIVKTGRGLRE